MTKNFKEGDILENSVGDFCKVISADVEAESYSISDWTNRKSAEEATVATAKVNLYGLQACEAQVAGTSKKATAPKKAVAPKKVTTAPKVAGKTAPKKAK